MIKAKKGLLIALFAAMMVFAFGATSAFAASTTDAGHSFGDRGGYVDADYEGLTVIVEPTCEAPGVGQITCDEVLKNGEACTAIKTVKINPLGHEKGDKKLYSADELLDAFGYDADIKALWFAEHPRNCEVYVSSCKNCGKLGQTYRGQFVLYENAWEVQKDWELHEAPTDLPDCAGSFTCALCGKTDAQNAKYNAQNQERYHQPDAAAVSVDPIRMHETAKGYVLVNKYTCELCDTSWKADAQVVKIDQSYEPKHGATTRTEVRPATCYQQGIIQDTCNDCGMVVNTEHTEKLAHSYTTVTKTGGALNDWENPEMKKTYDEDLLYSCDQCAVCGYIKESSIVAEGFIPEGSDLTVEYAQLVPANCEQGAWVMYMISDGRQGVWSDTQIKNMGVREVAGKFYITDPVTEKRAEIPYAKELEHKFGTPQKVSDPTCTQRGLDAKVCENCGAVNHYTEQNTGQPLGHEVKPVVVPATCGTKGYTYNVCTRCNEYISKDGKSEEYEEYDVVAPVVALGTPCNYEWKVLEEATPFALGTRAKVCVNVNCGHQLEGTTESVAKTTIAAPAVKTTKNKAKVTVKAVEGAVQYQVLVNGKVKIKNAKVGKNTVKKLKANKKYKFQVRAINADGVQATSKAKTAKTKKK